MFAVTKPAENLTGNRSQWNPIIDEPETRPVLVFLTVRFLFILDASHRHKQAHQSILGLITLAHGALRSRFSSTFRLARAKVTSGREKVERSSAQEADLRG